MQRYHRHYTSTTPQVHQKERALSDIQYTDIMFVYPMTLVKDSLGDPIKDDAKVPRSYECSFQEHALDSERSGYDRVNNHYARIFTRHQHAVKWGDRIICRGIEMICEKAIDRIDNYDGSFHHLEIRAKYDKQDGAVNEDPVT